MWKDPLNILIKPRDDGAGADPLGILKKKDGGSELEVGQDGKLKPSVPITSHSPDEIDVKAEAAKYEQEKAKNKADVYKTGASLFDNETLKNAYTPQDNSQPAKQVTPQEFLEKSFGIKDNDFAPHKIYNNAKDFILQDLEKHPTLLKEMPYPEKFKEQVINGDGGINIQRYTDQRVGEIEGHQKEVGQKIFDEINGIVPDKKKIADYRSQLENLEKEKETFKTNASELNDIQSVTQTPPPTDPKDQTEYFRTIGKNVNKFTDPVGIANQEKNIKDGTTGARDRELVDLENFSNEQAGIEAKKKQLDISAGNGQITPEDYNTQMQDVKVAESKLLSNNPGAKTAIDRSTLSKIIEDNRQKKSDTEKDPNKVKPFSGTLFHDIINYTPSENEVKEAIKTAREQGASISADEEKKYIEDRGQIPGTSTLGNLYQSSIGGLSTAINAHNPFLSPQEIEGEKYREERLFQPTQRQTNGVLGYVNQTANVVGTVLKWATLGKFLGAGADAVLGSTVGAETVGGIDETLGGVKKLSEAQQHLAGTALTSGLLVYPEAKEEAKKFTTDESKQDAYAGTMTLLNTLAFTSLNPEGILKGIVGDLGKSDFSKEFLKVVNKAGGIEKLEPETFKTTVLNGLKKAAGANLNATATMSLLNLATQATDVMFGKKPNVDMAEVGKEAINSFISFAPLSLLQGAGVAIGDKNKRDITIQLVNQAVKDPIAFKDYMDKAVDEGRVSRDDANKKIQVVNSQSVLSKSVDLPAHIGEENKATYVDNLRREIKIKQSIKNIDDEVLTKKKEEEIKTLQQERKDILEAPATSEEEKLVNDARNNKQLGVYGNLSNDEILKEAAKQAQNVQEDGSKSKLISDEQAYQQTVRQFGGNEDLVKAAIAKHPKETLLNKQELSDKNDMSGLSHADWFLKNKDKFSPEDFTRIKDNLASNNEADKNKAIEEIVAKKEEVKNENKNDANETNEVPKPKEEGGTPKEGIDKNIEQPKEEPLQSTVVGDNIKVGELIDKPITYEGKPATLYQDGQTVVAKLTGQNKEFELGNIDEIKDHPISDYGIEHETSVVGINDNGNVTVRGDEFKNNYSNPLSAINHNKDGNVVSVNLETADGKKRTFRGSIAEDIAYQIHLKEINKNNETKSDFEKFINTDEPTATEINNAKLPTTTEAKPIENNAKVSRTKAVPKPIINNKPIEEQPEKVEPPIEPPKEEDGKTESEGEEKGTAIRKEKQREISEVEKAYKEQKRIGWGETMKVGLEKIQKSHPEKNLYDAALNTMQQIREGGGYGDLTPNESLAVMQYLKHEIGKKRSVLSKTVTSDSDVERLAALTQDELLEDDYVNTALTIKDITTQAGRTLNYAQSELFDSEHGLQIHRMDLMRAKGGEKLSEEDLKWTQEKWNEEKKLMELEQAAREGGMKSDFDKKVADLQKEYENKLKSQKPAATDKTSKEKTFKQSGKEIADKIRKLKLTGTKVDFTLGGWNLAVEGIAKLVEGGATIADAIQKLIDSKVVGFKDDKDRGIFEDLFNEKLNQKTPEETLSEIKKFAEENKETDLSNGMVAQNLISDYVNSHIGEVDQKDILDKATEGLKEVLPDITKEKVIEAYLKEGEFKQPTKKDLEGGIAEQKKQLKSIAKLEEDISDLNDLKKVRRRNFPTEREKSEYEQKLADEKTGIVKEQKDRRNKIIEDNKKLETERNRQLKIVTDLKDKKAKLEQGIIEKKEKLDRSADTPEIEKLRADVKDLEKSIREATAAQKAAESKIERDRNRQIKTDNAMVVAERDRQLQKVQDLTDKKEKLEQGIRDKKSKIPAKPDTPEIENLKTQIAEADKKLREAENEANKLNKESQTRQDKLAELDANIKRAESGQDIIKTFRNKPDNEIDEEISAKNRQLKKAINDNTPENKVQDKLLKDAKENAIKKTKEFQRKLDEGDFEEPKQKILNKEDAELIRLNKQRSIIEGEYRQKQEEYRHKNKSNIELAAEFGRSVYVAFLLHRFLTLGKVALASVVRPIVEGGTRMTFGKVFDKFWPGIGKSALLGGESSSWKANKLGFEAWYKQRGERAIEKMAVKSETAFQKADKYYNDYKAIVNSIPKQKTKELEFANKRLERLNKERNIRMLSTFGNLAYQFIGGASIKDALQAFVHRSNEIERQFGKVHSEGIQGKNEIRQSDSFKGIGKKLGKQVVEGGIELFTNYDKSQPLTKQVAIKLIDDADYLLGFIGRSHSAAKTFSGRYSFASGFMARLEGAVGNNIELTPDKVLEYAHESYLDWERGKYQNPSQLNTWWSGVINRMDKGKDASNIGKAGKLFFQTEVAIKTVPLNILWEEISQYAGGLAKIAGIVPGKTRLASIPKLYGGIKEGLKEEGLFTNTPEFKAALKEKLDNIDPYQAALIKTCFRKGSLGMGIYATALILGGIHYGIFPHMGQKKKKDESELGKDELNPGQLMIGETKFSEETSALISHTQFLWPTFMGLGMAQAYHDNVKSGQTTAEAITKAAYLHLNIIAGNVPQFALFENLKERSIDPSVKKIIKSTLGEKHQGFDSKDEKDPTFKYYFDKGVEFSPFNPSKIDIPNKGKLSDLPQEKWKEYNTAKKESLKENLEELKDQTFYVTKDGKVHTEEPDEDEVGVYDTKTLGQLTVQQLKKVIVPAESKATTAAKEKLADE